MKTMSKLKFAWTKGGAVSWIAFGALMLAAVLVAVSMYNALFGSILDMPFMNVIDTVTEGSVAELEEELDRGKDVEDEARDILDELENENLSKKEEKLVEKAEELVEELGDLMDCPSLMVMRSASGKIADDEELIEMLELADGATASRELQQDAEEIFTVLNIVVIVIAGCFGLAILFTVLAAMLRSTVLAVFGMLGSVALCALFGGAIFAVGVLVLDITAMVLHGVLKKNYTKYLYPGYTG